MTGQEIVDTQKNYYLQSWAKQRDVNPIPIEKAEGIYMWDYDGNRYTDMSSTQVNVNLGYGNEDINNALKQKYGENKNSFLNKTIPENERILSNNFIDIKSESITSEKKIERYVFPNKSRKKKSDKKNFSDELNRMLTHILCSYTKKENYSLDAEN